jgi:hypothetical protein
VSGVSYCGKCGKEVQGIMGLCCACGYIPLVWKDANGEAIESAEKQPCRYKGRERTSHEMYIHKGKWFCRFCGIVGRPNSAGNE